MTIRIENLLLGILIFPVSTLGYPGFYDLFGALANLSKTMEMRNSIFEGTPWGEMP
jgi:hypothetical protein